MEFEVPGRSKYDLFVKDKSYKNFEVDKGYGVAWCGVALGDLDGIELEVQVLNDNETA